MKHLKKFNENTSKPKIGDYVLIETDSSNKKIVDFINNTIGKIIHIDDNKIDIWGNISIGDILVKYDNVPFNRGSANINWFIELNPNIEDTCVRHYGIQYGRHFHPNRIVEFGKTREELEIKLQAKKYNL